jgi:hydroxyacid-oxoacid transhydrogenase
MSVVVHAPAVFRWTAVTDPERHLRCAQILGANIADLGAHDPREAGTLLSERITVLMQKMQVPNGLSAFGYTTDDVDSLVEGALPQRRVLDIAPAEVDGEVLRSLYQESLEVYS